jgi:hypothetical protein
VKVYEYLEITVLEIKCYNINQAVHIIGWFWITRFGGGRVSEPGKQIIATSVALGITATLIGLECYPTLSWALCVFQNPRRVLCRQQEYCHRYRNPRQYRQDNYIRRSFWMAIMQRIKLKPCREETFVIGIVITYLCVTVTQDV